VMNLAVTATTKRLEGDDEDEDMDEATSMVAIRAMSLVVAAIMKLL
jgi:hypothetical protein